MPSFCPSLTQFSYISELSERADRNTPDFNLRRVSEARGQSNGITAMAGATCNAIKLIDKSSLTRDHCWSSISLGQSRSESHVESMISFKETLQNRFSSDTHKSLLEQREGRFKWNIARTVYRKCEITFSSVFEHTTLIGDTCNFFTDA